MLDDPLFITSVFALGLIIGWAMGTIRTHAFLIGYFRDYYRDYYHRQAEERMRAYQQFLLSQVRVFGAAAFGHRRVETGAFDWGLRGSRSTSARSHDARMSGPEHEEGGDAYQEVASNSQ